MKFTWNQLTFRPALQNDAAELSAIQRAQAIRARADRLYVLGEMALAAQLLLELEGQQCWA